MRFGRKELAICLVAVLAASIGVVAAEIYFQNKGTYTIIGTLSYAPGHAIYLGISAQKIIPTISPKPINSTFTEADGTNYTVASFVFLDFSDKFTFPPNSGNAKYGYDNYPVGFAPGDTVKVSGKMTYSEFHESYVMNVVSISHYSP